MFEPNPIAHVQIPIWKSSSDDDELQEDNFYHDDDADNNIDEEFGIDDLHDSPYVPYDDYERDCNE